jgi:hypothetical protein
VKTEQLDIGLSLLFSVGERPSVADIDRMLSSPELAGPAASIVHRPPADEGWLELLASGLTFDIVGLAPSPAMPLIAGASFHGLPADVQAFALEPVMLKPAPHLAGGGAMLPVVRVMTSLAASLALHLPAKAVCWQPARSWMDPSYFARAMVGWLSGGSFPALGLTAVEWTPEGAVQTRGLRFFTGQELLLDGRPGEDRADTIRIAARVIDYLVRKGAIASLEELEGPARERLFAEPSADGQLVRVWRGR